MPPAVDHAAAPVAAKKPGRKWSPRIWIGMCLGTWWKFLLSNRVAVSPRHWPKILFISTAGFFNTLLWAVEKVLFGWAIARQRPDPRPLIILGHWRSGTTWLHELLGLDPQFTSPDTYQAMAPNHFIVSRWWASRLFFFFLPERRPMDNMLMGWDHPQEDEFALCNMGLPSPYLNIAFPNNPPKFDEYLTLDGVAPADVARWKRALWYYLQKITFVDRRRIILKSPPHTARVRTLLEMFPDARFVYLVRDPYVLFPSTVHLWKRLYETHGMQIPTFQGLDERVFDTFLRMTERFEEDRKLIPPGRLFEIRYEDFAADPVGRLQSLYQQLELGDFEQVRPAVERYIANTADYQTNKYRLTDAERAEIGRRWRSFIEKYGYDEPPAPPQSAQPPGDTA